MLRWRLSPKGNWTAIWCGRRTTVYRDRRGQWRVVISRLDADTGDEAEFFDFAWSHDRLEDAKEWAEEALRLRGTGGEPPPPPQQPPEAESTAYKPWKAGVRPSAASLPGWALVLGVTHPLTVSTIRSAYRALAKQHHPDRGGDTARMAAINAAWEDAQAYLGVRGGIT